MRFLIVALTTLGILAGSAVLPIDGAATSALTTVVAAQQPAGQAQIDIDINRGGGDWWMSPTWIAIGVLGLVLLIVVIALMVRGGGTTIVKE
jgi:hypothetical protein